MTKCLVCPGDSGDNYCKVGETGESEDCGGPVTNRVCFEMGSKDGTDEQHIKRAGCVNLEDAKNKAKKHGVVLNGKDECNSVEERGEIIGNAVFWFTRSLGPVIQATGTVEIEDGV